MKMFSHAENVMTENDNALTFRMMLDEARDWAERSGLREDMIDDIIKSVRRRKKHEDSY